MTPQQDQSAQYYESSLNFSADDFIKNLFDDEGPFDEADCAGL